ncbi:hypothetical protein FNF27_00824 [Cafeteria roenbergensis]|uniref:Signal recognition particle receptor subunit beta n=1 Tax=Cafeteria roenbergensis TaxID=33653 RepID=A0A5A8EPM5_CAFRO|nr:hypothetical protein FNF29_01071 [Cafeteria roenbergensis]KAA0177651.1 hypothetical protein FNF27_00824 [Cafeteria roenbergensis]|eukprot:KAA0156278.1 hypothetical protein FNF29_01071 [Cafeteria roenbergensis]
MGQSVSANVLVVGLDRSGKSLLTRRLSGCRASAGKHDVVMPTAALERTRFQRDGVRWTLLELKSHSVAETRTLMEPWVSATSAVIFVVDASDSIRLAELAQAFTAVWEEASAKRLPIAVAVNRGKPVATMDFTVAGDLVHGVDHEVALELLPPDGRGLLDASVTSRLLRLDTKADGRPLKLFEVDALSGNGCDALLAWLRIHVGGA